MSFRDDMDNTLYHSKDSDNIVYSLIFNKQGLALQVIESY